ncbi:putative phospholipase/carboxylesterase [Phyllosticta citriasiana]|uniref:Phospholipase/carboxylesterase n=1 Tax=Phyllosticta citriasiana TaxID=595635 RepID=A0ABR1KLF9_9PEZI
MIWPDPLIFSPTAPHSHSIILLHGRGSNAERFGVELLKSRNSEGKTLAECFPGTKFIFPAAKKRRSTVLKRIPINQWFDNFSLDDPSERQHLQYDGIRETSAFIHDLIEKEACLVGLSNVVIGGLSQGCAAALHVLLNFGPKECVGKESASLAGFVGMSGWLPFADMLDPQATDRHEQDGEECVDHEDDDIFGSDEESLEPRQLRAFNTARDIASLPPLSGTLDEAAAFARTPVFLGHGRHDEKVSVKLGSQARAVLEALGCKVRWEDYDEGHWYKVPDEIDDIVDFLQTEAGFRMAENDLV